MTEQQGLFTVQSILYLTKEQRARLEHLVRTERIDPADLVSQIVADCSVDRLPCPDRERGEAAVPVRLYLAPAQRQHFDDWTHMYRAGLPDLISAVVGQYLDRLPDISRAPTLPPPTDIQRLRGDLGRLRARRDAEGRLAPAWLGQYIADLEAEIRRLEH